MKIIKVTAMWCSSCLIMTNTFNKIQKKYPNIEIVSYDYDMDEETVSKYNVKEILPVLIFVKQNKEITRLVGEKTQSEIEEIIEKLESDKIEENI